MTPEIFKIIPNLQKALFLAKRQLPEFVYDAVNLEGIHYTMPEIQTLLDGVAVGGHKVSDQIITLNQAAAWRWLFDTVEQQQFVVSKVIACELHAIAAQQESLTWGKFRDGNVTIAGTDYMPPPAQELDKLWDDMFQQTDKIVDIYPRAIFIFLTMSSVHFFYDVNKRMGRFMMNGLLLSQGYPVINLPVKRQLEFNKLMLAFYASADVRPMTQFMQSCLDERNVAFLSG